MRRAARIDSTQPAIVKALRQIGASVQPLHTVGGGVPDLLVGYRGRNLLIECKSPGGRLTEDQITWHLGWRGDVAVCDSEWQALDVIARALCAT